MKALSTAAALAVAAFALATASLPARAFAPLSAPVCSPDQIRIELLPFEAKHDYSVPFAELDGDEAVGLVRQTTTVRVNGCTATVGYANPMLYVARELVADECAFDTVLEHEQHHLRIYRDALADLEERIRRSAASRPLFDAAVSEVRAVQARHAAFDAAEHAAEDNVHACDGRIFRLVMHRRGRATTRT